MKSWQYISALIVEMIGIVILLTAMVVSKINGVIHVEIDLQDIGNLKIFNLKKTPIIIKTNHRIVFYWERLERFYQS